MRDGNAGQRASAALPAQLISTPRRRQRAFSAYGNEGIQSWVELRNALQQVCTDAKLDDKYVKLQQAGSELVTKAS